MEEVHELDGLSIAQRSVINPSRFVIKLDVNGENFNMFYLGYESHARKVKVHGSYENMFRRSRGLARSAQVQQMGP